MRNLRPRMSIYPPVRRRQTGKIPKPGPLVSSCAATSTCNTLPEDLVNEMTLVPLGPVSPCEPTEAPLLPHHFSDRSRLNLPDPVYWVTPRHPAGDDGGPAGRIGVLLSDLV